MASGRVSSNFRQRGEASIFLRRPQLVERGSGQIAELSIVVEDTGMDVKLTRDELQLLVERGQMLLDGGE